MKVEEFAFITLRDNPALKETAGSFSAQFREMENRTGRRCISIDKFHR